jgi:penicillin-binding protein 1A
VSWLPAFGLRVAVATVSFLVVAAVVVIAGSAIALEIDWEIPEGRALRGPSIVYDRNGDVIARLAADVEFRRVTLDEIAPSLRDAVIATEDRRFYEHQGVDPLSVLRAIVSNIRFGGIREGGSTLTQQYVKNVYVGFDQTLYRKIREALVALQLEKERSKDEILEAYLNHVYFGQGAYGAEAAARTYFDKHASELTIGESAVLASLLAAPSTLNPVADRQGARQRRDVVLDEMVRDGAITAAQATKAKARKVRLADRQRRPVEFPYFVEEVRTQLLDQYGEEAVYHGGLRVQTTLDPAKQRMLERIVSERLPDNRGLDAGVVALDPRTGDVIAAYSGRDFDRRQVDLAFGRGTNGRPSGSTFKVFALAAALEEGKTLASTYPAPGSITIGGWTASGTGGCGSPCTLLSATALSANTVFAQVGRDVGAEGFTDMAKRLGVRQRFRDPDLPMVLGTADVTPLDMASAFGTLANDGVACPARVVTGVAGGDTVRRLPDPRRPGKRQRERIAEHFDDLGYRFDDGDLGRCHRAVAPSVTRNTTRALEAVVQWGTGHRADIGRPQAGKTGTTQANREAWFVGYTPDLALAVSFYNVESQIPLSGVPGCSSVCFGGELPALIWHDVALALLRGVPERDFPKPIPDERRFASPDRRRLGPSVGVGPVELYEPPAAVPGAVSEQPVPQDVPTADQPPSPSPTEPPDSDPEPTPEPEPTEDDDGGIIPPLPPPP